MKRTHLRKPWAPTAEWSLTTLNLKQWQFFLLFFLWNTHLKKNKLLNIPVVSLQISNKIVLSPFNGVKIPARKTTRYHHGIGLALLQISVEDSLGGLTRWLSRMDSCTRSGYWAYWLGNGEFFRIATLSWRSPSALWTKHNILKKVKCFVFCRVKNLHVNGNISIQLPLRTSCNSHLQKKVCLYS